MAVIALLIVSNVFMTIAWYEHLRHTDKALPLVIFASWGVALIEYCFAVPANRIGYASGWTAGQLKVTQEVITLLVFAVFAVVRLGEPLKWNHGAAFLCLVAAVLFIFSDKLTQ
jgi:hypothetical protein